MTSLNLDSKIIRHPDIISTDMDGETVMMSIAQGEYYGLTDVGSYIWEFMTTPISIQDLSLKVLDEFEIDESTCQQDLLTYAEQLIEKGVAQLAN